MLTDEQRRMLASILEDFFIAIGTSPGLSYNQITRFINSAIRDNQQTAVRYNSILDSFLVNIIRKQTSSDQTTAIEANFINPLKTLYNIYNPPENALSSNGIHYYRNMTAGINRMSHTPISDKDIYQFIFRFTKNFLIELENETAGIDKNDRGINFNSQFESAINKAKESTNNEYNWAAFLSNIQPSQQISAQAR